MEKNPPGERSSSVLVEGSKFVVSLEFESFVYHFLKILVNKTAFIVPMINRKIDETIVPIIEPIALSVSKFLETVEAEMATAIDKRTTTVECPRLKNIPIVSGVRPLLTMVLVTLSIAAI